MARQKQLMRSVVSLFIFIHLFCVAVSLWKNNVTSFVFQRISDSVSWYTKIFAFDSIASTDYFLTHAMPTQDDYHFEIILPDREEPIRLPDSRSLRTGSRLGSRYERFRLYAQRAGFTATIEDDSAMAQYARCIGSHFFHTEEYDRLVVRLVAFQPMSYREIGDRTHEQLRDPTNYSSVYEADVWKNEDGSVGVHKRVATGEAAPLKKAESS